MDPLKRDTPIVLKEIPEIYEEIPEIPMPTEHNEHKEHVQGIRTFSSDMAEAMREGKGSIIKIAIAEDERRRADRQEIESAPRKNLMLFLGGLIIFAVAIAGIYGLFVYRKNSAVVPVEQNVIPKSIIRSEDAGTLDITGKINSDIIDAIKAVVAKPGIRSGTVKNLILAKNSGAKDSPMTRIPASDFLKILHSHAPDQFSRAISQDFMLGVYLYNTSNLFLVIKGVAHDYMLSGMLGWEPFLMQDMVPLFGIDVTGNSASLLNAKFKDTLVQNRDARAVVGSDGNPVLFYSFLDPNTVFIATDPKTLLEAVRRFEE